MEDNYHKPEVIFKEDTHQYFVDGEERFSVTTGLKLLGLATDYSTIDPSVLKAKAEYGTLIHDGVDRYYKFGEVPFTPEAMWVVEALNKEGFSILATEQIVYNDILAGTCDILAEKDGEIWTLDIKNTASRNIPYVTYQTNFYGDMSPLNVTRHAVIYPILEESRAEIVQLVSLPKETLQTAYKCIREGSEFKPVLVGYDYDLNVLKSIEEHIIDCKNEIERLKGTYEDVKKTILNAMINNAIYSLETDNLKLTVKNGYNKASVDTKRFKTEEPELYEKYKKSTYVAPTLLVNLKEKEEEDNNEQILL